MSTSAKVIGDVRCQLGEGPLWSARDQCIYWVDILSPALHRFSLLSCQVSSWPMPERIGWVIERSLGPGFIAGFQSGFYQLELDPIARTLLLDPEPHLPDNRMNDAKADHLGRIWAGTMSDEAHEARGSLYCLDPIRGLTRQDTDYLISNGPAFGLNRECMYHTDSGLGVIYRFTLFADGSLGERRPFLRFPVEWGKPDGMTVDAEGGLWVAHWGGSCLSRFTPDGTLDRRISLPTTQITSCVFGGRELNRLFATSAAVGTSGDPLAGTLFEIDPQGIRGLAPQRYAG